MHIEVVTLFPELIREAVKFGVLGRALERGIVRLGCEDPRAHTRDVHRTVDDQAVWRRAGHGAQARADVGGHRGRDCARLPAGAPRVYLSAQGVPFTQALAKEFATLPGLLLVAGRYEGLDERVIESRIDREVSIGDYVLSGGEFPALVVLDAVARLLPGVLGDLRSSVEESFDSGLLDWPHYTRPVEFEGRKVPEVLQGGHHADIQRWRLKQAVTRTWLRRPDLIARGGLSAEAAALLDEFLAEREGEEHG